MSDPNHVVLVDYEDNPIGIMEKLEAHQNGGHLHRAFSVQLFDRQGRLLLQQRAGEKYHCPGLWTNTCCRAEFDNGLTEYEFDRVFVGITDSAPSLNRDEAQDRKRISRDDLEKDIAENSDRYTPRFLILIREHKQHFLSRLSHQNIHNA